MPEVLVVKKVEIDAAHYLPKYLGKCSQLHGHRWTVEVGVSGPVDSKTGMVVDFAELKSVLEPLVERFDHHLVNDVIENPTAENIALYFYQELSTQTWVQGRLAFVKVWETPDSYAEVRKGRGPAYKITPKSERVI